MASLSQIRRQIEEADKAIQLSREVLMNRSAHVKRCTGTGSRNISTHPYQRPALSASALRAADDRRKSVVAKKVVETERVVQTRTDAVPYKVMDCTYCCKICGDLKTSKVGDHNVHCKGVVIVKTPGSDSEIDEKQEVETPKTPPRITRSAVGKIGLDLLKVGSELEEPMEASSSPMAAKSKDASEQTNSVGANRILMKDQIQNFSR